MNLEFVVQLSCTLQTVSRSTGSFNPWQHKAVDKQQLYAQRKDGKMKLFRRADGLMRKDGEIAFTVQQFSPIAKTQADLFLI